MLITLIANSLPPVGKSVRLLSGAFFALWLTGCASTPQTQSLTSHPPDTIRSSVELESVPFFPQQAYQCGPAALATMLVNEAIDVQPDALVSKVYIPARKGSLQLEMVATARSYGMVAYQLEPELEALLAEVNAGNPVLVFQNLAYNWAPQWHYAVVVGYHLPEQRLILRSGTEKRHEISLQTFERTWQRGKHWAYVILPPTEVPVSATALNYTKSANALMKSGQAKAALTAYQTATQHWPQQALTFMALGNAEYALKHYDNAAKAFNAASQLAPEDPQIWNNLAYAYAANQCSTAAKQAIQCAIELSPDDPNLQHSQQDILGMKTTSPSQCAVPICPARQKSSP